MDNQQSGLRFDIYERVHLPEESEGIRELSDLELVPMIRMIREGEQALLTGNLVLSGSYESDGEHRGEQKLEHLIPVEITLPINRIRSFDQIAVDIDNFDVELLSSRTLNVTGVLSLQGVEVLTHAQEQEEDGEVVFIHHVSDDDEGAQPPMNRGEKEDPSGVDAAQMTQTEPESQEYDNPEFFQSELAEDTVSQETVEFEDIGENAEKLQPVKIAIGGKREPERENETPVNLQTLLFKETPESSMPAREAESPAITLQEQSGGTAKPFIQAEAETETANRENERDGVEWKKLFLQSSTDTAQFSRLRIRIVQKDETVETIASKYNVPPQKIRLLNRLGDQDVAEGQLIYIP